MRNFLRHPLRAGIPLVSMLSFCSLPASAVVFDASASAALNVIGIDDGGATTGEVRMEVFGDPFLDDSGNALAEVDLTVSNSGSGFGFDTLGEALSSAIGDGTAEAQAFAEISITNETDATVLIDFTLDWSLSAAAGLTTGRGDAFADAYVELFVDGLVNIDGDDMQDYEFNEYRFADALFGPPSDGGAATTPLPFTLQLPPNETAAIDFEVGSSGSAVPIPGALPLLLLGLGVLGAGRTRVGSVPESA